MKNIALYICFWVSLCFSVVILGCNHKDDLQKNSNNDYVKENERLCPNTESVYVPEYLFNRFEDVVKNYESSELPVLDTLKNKIIFYGSSTMYFWGPYLKENFYPLPVIGHGFGGSTFPEMIFFSPRLLYPFNPKIIVLYCENDLFNLPVKSTNQVRDDICEQFARIHENLPNTKIYYLAMKHSFARDFNWSSMNEVNQKVKGLCDSTTHLNYIDLNYTLLNLNGKLDSTLFEKDMLHMNQYGYKKWSIALKPILEKEFN